MIRAQDNSFAAVEFYAPWWVPDCTLVPLLQLELIAACLPLMLAKYIALGFAARVKTAAF